MATVTPTYSWPVPTSTDYVKDGATAIESLGDAIDSTLTTALGGAYPGMRRIGSVTATGASSVDITNCFSSTYQNYHLEANVTGASSGNTGIVFQLLNGTTAQPGNPWAYGSFFTNTAGGSGVFINSNGTWGAWIMQAGLHSSNQIAQASVDIKNPFTTSRTSYNTQAWNSYGAGDVFSFGGGYNDSSSFNGIRFLAQAGGTFSGTFTVYGYGQS